MKPHKHAEFIKAWADGEVIQWRFSNDDVWHPLGNSSPKWDELLQYRIKPTAPKWPETTMTHSQVEEVLWKAMGHDVPVAATIASRCVANAAIAHACETGQLVTKEAYENAIQKRDEQIETLRAHAKSQGDRMSEMRANPATTENRHRAIQNEKNVGGYSPMRHCKGECKKRRSIMQFVGDSQFCLKCTRRGWK